jgi:hypothetical protein
MTRVQAPGRRQRQPQRSASLPALTSRADFDRVARIFDPASAMPHVLFVIDAKARAHRCISSTRRATRFTKIFCVPKPAAGGKPELNRNYREPGRRFILGTLSWQPVLKDYSYEFWEGDQLTPELLKTTGDALKTGFFAPVRFKANSTSRSRRPAGRCCSRHPGPLLGPDLSAAEPGPGRGPAAHPEPGRGRE